MKRATHCHPHTTAPSRVIKTSLRRADTWNELIFYFFPFFFTLTRNKEKPAYENEKKKKIKRKLNFSSVKDLFVIRSR